MGVSPDPILQPTGLRTTNDISFTFSPLRKREVSTIRRQFRTMSVASHIGVFPIFPTPFSHRKPSPSNAYFLRPKLAFTRRRLQRGGPACAFGGKGKQQKGNDDAALWKSLEKSVDNLKKDKSIEGMLREQMQKQKLDRDDGGGGGGRNFRGRGDDGSSETEPEDHVDEFFQIFLASIGIICVVICLQSLSILFAKP
ncbi:hypothetical protein ZOSMA_349G00090 [Zostera marina]|uniref:Uncharacterized protein n=1 Tax=Zostera marina TaxID=29655 RepID=A0A0K9P9J2_ZOSMR|nr:hypothetical protein ZOSMA_349G00090 [Zostera marina]